MAVDTAEEIHIGDIGTQFILTLIDAGAAADISTATEKTIYFLKPDGSTLLTKTAVFVTDGSDGQVKYTSISGDLDTEGVWSYQAKVVLPSGTWHSETDIFTVYPNLAGV